MSENGIWVRSDEAGGSYFIVVDNVKYKCSYAESAIMTALLGHKSEFYTKESLAEIGWPGKLVTKNSVPVAIANLRKIFKNHTQLEVIVNEKNKGYTISVDKVRLAPPENEELLTVESAQRAATSQSDAPVDEPNKITPQAKPRLLWGQRLKRWASIGSGFPLLALNFLLLVILLSNGHSQVPTSILTLVDGPNYTAVLTTDDPSTSPLSFSAPPQAMRFEQLSMPLESALNSNKPVMFINSVGKRHVIDCLFDGKLISYSGDDIDAIRRELSQRGCLQ